MRGPRAKAVTMSSTPTGKKPLREKGEGLKITT